MKVLIVLVGLTIWQADAQVTPNASAPLRCRRCIGATNLDDCTFSVPCPKGEVCYMDEVVTEQLTIEYNGGCRPRDVCSRGAIGKKRDGALVACTKCCDLKKSPECNTKMCGIKSSNSSQCYHCTNDGNGGSGVKNPEDCTNLVSCQSDEVCGSETYKLAAVKTFEFKCLPKQICTLVTKQALEELAYCKTAGADPDRCNIISKRETSGKKICTACCGDSQCNSGTCEDMMEQLYALYKGGVLVLETLKKNGTLKSTTVAAPTNPTTTTTVVAPAAVNVSTSPIITSGP